jgi:hypothetical protein
MLHRPCIFAAVLLAQVVCFAQTRPTSLAINSERPFVYLEFVRVGARQPLAEGEGRLGIWIRLRNNSIYPLDLDVYHVDSAKAEVALRHTVVAVGQPGLRRVPVGYDTSDTGSQITVKPGGSRLFSIPAEHVAPDWYVRVKFEMRLPQTPKGRTPTTFVDFVWTDIPLEQQKAVRRPD